MTKRQASTRTWRQALLCAALAIFLAGLLTPALAWPPGGAALAEGRTAASPPPRYRHTLVALSGKAYLFGGMVGGEPGNDLWLWDGDWRERAPATGPAARSGHAAAMVGGRMFIFFGQGVGGAVLDDVWAYDPAANLWTSKLSRGVSPAPRFGHSAVAVGSDVLIFGGETTAGAADKCIWRYQTATETWQEGACLENPPFGGGYAVANVSSRILVYPGGAALSRLLRYSTEDDAWGEVTVFDDSLAPRAQAAVAAQGDRMWLFGGTIEGLGQTPNILEFRMLPDGTQVLLAPLPCLPAARTEAQAVVLSTSLSNGVTVTSVLIFGGRRGDEPLAEPLIYRIGPPAVSATATPSITRTPSPPAASSATPTITATPTTRLPLPRERRVVLPVILAIGP